jgi:uncharacterized protein
MALSRIFPGRRHIAVALSALLLAGCLGKGGTSTRYYLVDPVQPENAAPATTPLAVEIMDLEIPQYLERFQIATRTGSNGIVYAEYHQWGENLRKNLLRTLARNLALLLGSSDVSTPLNRSLATPDYRVQMHVDQFEQDVDGRVRLKARWQVLDARAKRAVPTSHVTELESGEAYGAKDFEQVVAAMTGLYGTLATQVAASIAPAPAGTGQ